MKRIWISLLLAALWLGAVEPALQVRFGAQAQRLSVGGKDVEVPAGDADGWCAFGRRGLALPLSTLVGKSGTILARFRIDKPEGEQNVARLVFHLRCLSRMVTGVCNIPNQGNRLLFQFGDHTTAPQIYLLPRPEFSYGKEHTAGISWNGERVRFFLDGRMVGDFAQTVEMAKVDRLVIATDKDRWYRLPPLEKDCIHLKEIRIYREGVAAAEVAQALGGGAAAPSTAVDGALAIPLEGKAPAPGAAWDSPVWRRAASILELQPVMTSRAYGFDSPESRVLLTATKERLLVGFEYTIPAGNAVAAGQLRTAALEPEVWGSESWEFYLQFRGRLYRFAGNAAGGFCEGVDGESAWNPRWEYRSQLSMQIDNSQRWRGEISIPWSVFGLAGAPQEPFRLNWCRSWFIGDYTAPCSLFGQKLYRDPSRFLTARVAPQVATVQQVSRPEPGSGSFRQSVRISAPKGAKVDYEVSLLRQDGAAAPAALFAKRLTMAAEEATLDAEGTVASSEYNLVRYSLKLDGKPQMCLYAPFRYAPVPLVAAPRFLAGRIEVTAKPALLGVRADAGAAVVLTGPDGKELARHALDSERVSLPFRAVREAGRYTVVVVSAAGKPLASVPVDYPGLGEWSRKSYPADIVLPPFTPLKSDAASGVFELWGRRYEYGASHFPMHLFSQGTELLLSPVRLVAGGEPLARQARRAGFMANRATACFASDSADARCSLACKTQVHYDGVAWHEVRLTAKQPLRNIALEIPLRPEQVRFLHAAIGGGWGRKQTISIPEGTTKLAFYPVLWLGMQDKGLCFFTQHRQGWTGASGEVIVITKQGGEALARINLRRELAAGETFAFGFGLQATPIRPLPRDYPLNVLDSMHTPKMRRRGQTPVNAITITGDWPHEYEAFFADLPTPEKPSIDAFYRERLRLRDQVGNRAIAYMDGMMLNDRYPEVAAFRPEWQLLPNTFLDYTVDGHKHQVFACCPSTAANAFFVEKAERMLSRYRFDGLYFDFGLGGVCNNLLHGHGEFWPLLDMREFYRRINLAELRNGIVEPIIALHNTDFVMPPVLGFATHLINGEHIRQHSSTIMHDGKDIQDTYGLEMFAAELSSLPFGLTQSVYQANDVLLPQFGGGKEDPELYKFRITKAFLAGTLPHNTMLSPWRCHFGIFDKLFRVYDRFGVPQATFTGYWDVPAVVTGAKDIYVSCYTSADGRRLLAVISHIGKEHVNQDFTVAFDAKKLGLAATPAAAVDTMNAPDPEYADLAEMRRRHRVHPTRAPIKPGDFGSRLLGYDAKTFTLKFHLDYHSFAIVELK